MREDGMFSKEIDRFEDDRFDLSLDRALSDRMLAEADSGSELAKSLELGVNLILPTSSEIDRVLEPERTAIPSDREIAEVILNGGLKEIALEGMSLNSLLDRGGGSFEERAILKRGMLFVSHRKYAEAAEWWTLNRPRESKIDPRFYTLSTLLLALTYQLAGQTQLAEAAIIAARSLMKTYSLYSSGNIQND